VVAVAETPSTLQQIILLALFVLPGITYQFVRERMRGPVPGERDLAERVLRALTASIVLDAIYLIAIGPWLMHMIKPSGRPWFAAAAAEPRQAAAVSLALFFAIPAAAALAVGMIERLRHPSRFDPIPTAWDGVFRGRSTGYVRARLKSGTWVGGWYGRRSRASAYPNPPDLYLESAYVMANDGSFGPRVQATGGVYVNMTDVEVLEFVEVANTEPEFVSGPGQEEGTSG
jgi:Family of unknown function (DUF6338)